MIPTFVASPRRIHPRWISPFVLLGLILLATACSDTPSPDLSSADVNPATVRFTSVTEEPGLTSFQHVNGNAGQFWMPELMGSGGGFLDYDGDGRLDVLPVGGGSLPGGPQADVPALVLYRNTGDPGSGPADRGPGQAPTFTEVTDEVGLGDIRAYGFGVTAADYDLDVLLTENNGPAHLWRNDLPAGHFLRVHVQGTKSNRDGIGARVRATVVRANLDSLVMERRVRTGSSYLSQSEPAVTFGLGSNRPVASLEVTWPSGQVEQFQQVAPNQEVLLVEGSGELVPVLPYDQAVARR